MRPVGIDLRNMSDLMIATLLARLDSERGGCLGTRMDRVKAIEALESEQDRRTAERCWEAS